MSDARAPKTKRAVSPKAILAVVILIVSLIFVFSNLKTATVDFLFFHLTLPGWIWFLLLLVAGVVIGSLFPWFRPRRRR